MIKVGVIGIGAMGSNHARVYSELPDVELVGIADLNKKTAKIISKKFDTAAFTDYRKLLKKGLDAVSVCVPTSFHEKISIDAINAGCHVLVEKPISDTTDGAKRIIRVAKKRGVNLMIGHVERFNPVVQAIKECIKKEKIITITVMRVGPLPPRVKDVGIVIDLGTHDIDLIRFITESEFKEISSFISRNPPAKEDAAILSFKMKNGTLANVILDWFTPFKVREIRVTTANRFLKGDLLNQKLTECTSYFPDGSFIAKELSIPHREPLKLELESFINCIKSDIELLVTGEDGLRTLEIALRCLQAETRKRG